MRSTLLIALAVAAVAPLSAQVVTPSNPQGWAEATFYGTHGTDPGTGASAAITNTYAHDGNGSVEIDLAHTSNSEADWYVNFTSPVALSSLTSLEYDWYRNGASTVSDLAAPAFSLLMSDNSYLIFEPYYNNGQTAAPVDQWVTENALGGIFWLSASGSSTCASATAYQSLADFNSSCFGGSGQVAGLDLFYGYGANEGTFSGAIDDVTFGANDATPTVFNFETDALPGTPVPEPAAMSMLAAGLVGLAGAATRKRKR